MGNRETTVGIKKKDGQRVAYPTRLWKVFFIVFLIVACMSCSYHFDEDTIDECGEFIFVNEAGEKYRYQAWPLKELSDGVLADLDQSYNSPNISNYRSVLRAKGNGDDNPIIFTSTKNDDVFSFDIMGPKHIIQLDLTEDEPQVSTVTEMTTSVILHSFENVHGFENSHLFLVKDLLDCPTYANVSDYEDFDWRIRLISYDGNSIQTLATIAEGDLGNPLILGWVFSDNEFYLSMLVYRKFTNQNVPFVETWKAGEDLSDFQLYETIDLRIILFELGYGDFFMPLPQYYNFYEVSSNAGFSLIRSSSGPYMVRLYGLGGFIPNWAEWYDLFPLENPSPEEIQETMDYLQDFVTENIGEFGYQIVFPSYETNTVSVSVESKTDEGNFETYSSNYLKAIDSDGELTNLISNGNFYSDPDAPSFYYFEPTSNSVLSEYNYKPFPVPDAVEGSLGWWPLPGVENGAVFSFDDPPRMREYYYNGRIKEYDSNYLAMYLVTSPEDGEQAEIETFLTARKEGCGIFPPFEPKHPSNTIPYYIYRDSGDNIYWLGYFYSPDDYPYEAAIVKLSKIVE